MTMKDLTGKRIGILTVLEYSGKNSNGYHTWKCQCDCGNIITRTGKSLKRGGNASCGCLHKAKDLTGMDFGNLTVLKKIGRKNGNNLWLCKCKCGNEVECYQYNLERGTSTSCGCLRSFYAKKTRKCHGESTGTLYKKWGSIKTRCYNKNTPSYKNYGGRGIKMCDEWLEFWNFREWAYKNGYSEELTLERIDVNGNYSPENCKWIPMEEQANNKRNSCFIEYGGKKQTLSQWSRELGVGKEVLSYRYHAGWSPEECLFGKATKGNHQLPRIEIPEYLKNDQQSKRELLFS